MWQLVWQVVFIVLLVMFAFLSVLVTWKGAADIRRLLKELDESGESEE